MVRFSAVTVEQVMRRHIGGRRQAYHRLNRLVIHGLVVHLRSPWVALPGIYIATPAGAELADVDLPAVRPKLGFLAHTVAVGDLADHLLTAYPGSTWTTERELRRDVLRRRREADSGQLGPARMSRTPDGLLTLPDATTVAIELELSAKSSERYSALLGATAAHRPAKKVWWYVRSSAARERIAKAARPYRLPDGFLELRPWPASGEAL